MRNEAALARHKEYRIYVRGSDKSRLGSGQGSKGAGKQGASSSRPVIGGLCLAIGSAVLGVGVTLLVMNWCRKRKKVGDIELLVRSAHPSLLLLCFVMRFVTRRNALLIVGVTPLFPANPLL